jgi:hypothetical protein
MRCLCVMGFEGFYRYAKKFMHYLYCIRYATIRAYYMKAERIRDSVARLSLF